jgi:hypothetical protein
MFFVLPKKFTIDKYVLYQCGFVIFIFLFPFQKFYYFSQLAHHFFIKAVFIKTKTLWHFSKMRYCVTSINRCWPQLLGLVIFLALLCLVCTVCAFTRSFHKKYIFSFPCFLSRHSRRLWLLKNWFSVNGKQPKKS